MAHHFTQGEFSNWQPLNSPTSWNPSLDQHVGWAPSHRLDGQGKTQNLASWAKMSGWNFEPAQAVPQYYEQQQQHQHQQLQQQHQADAEPELPAAADEKNSSEDELELLAHQMVQATFQSKPALSSAKSREQKRKQMQLLTAATQPTFGGFVSVSGGQAWGNVAPHYPELHDEDVASNSSPSEDSPQLQSDDSSEGADDIELQLNKQSLYKTELCRSFCETNKCRYGTKCQFAHGVSELRPVLRHPKYKTEICKTFHTIGTCPYGKRCRFIHTQHSQASLNSVKMFSPEHEPVPSDSPSDLSPSPANAPSSDPDSASARDIRRSKRRSRKFRPSKSDAASDANVTSSADASPASSDSSSKKRLSFFHKLVPS